MVRKSIYTNSRLGSQEIFPKLYRNSYHAIGVPVLSVNLVGEVISGKKTDAVIVFKKIASVSLFLIFNRFMLKSPAERTSAFRLSKNKEVLEKVRQ